MKILVGFAVAAALVGVGWTLFGGGPAFGIEASHPLGTGKAIGQYMKEHELDPGGEASPAVLARFFGTGFSEREDLVARRFLDRVPGYPHFVVVVFDTGGKVVAVGGQFRSGMREFSTFGPRSQAFCAYYWLDHAGADPVFKEKRWGERDGETYLEADYSGPGVTGYWRKDGPGGRALPHQMVDSFGFVLR